MLPLAALMSASLFTGRPTQTAFRVSEGLLASSTPSDTFISPTPLPPQVQEEFNYYLERHNVQDEGYEMVVAFANGQRHRIDLSDRLTLRNVGTWQGYRRQGTGITLDSLGRTVIGTWDADTLETGTRLDSLGTYLGDFHGTEAGGHGAYLHTDGSYFEGHWSGDRRDGFGIELHHDGEGEPRLRVGIWSRDRYQGERMKYTTERIYGIDIARYQHGKGRKKYPINWKRMRISFIGKRGSKNVSGTADYPVSFVFIKSTEGTTVRNQYYLSDYQQARRHGIRAGAYHFFSTRTSGSAQAQFFLKHTRFSKGDLPPVLDVEPSDAMIRQMGGPEQMFRQIRAWLEAVRRHTGVSPILYINQMFINKYLPLAPDIKRDYRVWIARYSEYKPDVRLTFWQLCPDGRVAGIQGDVDINVFNGYKSQFEEFIEQETIR